MRKEDQAFFSNYLTSDVGAMDHALFNLGLANVSLQKGGHLVEIKENGSSHFFLRSKNGNRGSTGIDSELAVYLPEKQKEAYLSASVSAKAFRFYRHGDKAVFSNTKIRPTMRHISARGMDDSVASTVWESINSLMDRNSGYQMYKFLVPQQSTQLEYIFVDWSTLPFNEGIRAVQISLLKIMEAHGIEATRVHCPDVEDAAAIYPLFENQHSIVVLMDPSKELDDDEGILEVVRRSPDGGPTIDIYSYVFFRNVAPTWIRYSNGSADPCVAQSVPASFVEKMIGELRLKGVPVTGRWTLGSGLGDAPNSDPGWTTINPNGRKLSRVSMLGHPPYFGPGKGYIVVKTYNSLWCVVIETTSPISPYGDMIRIHESSNPTKRYSVVGNSIWAGSYCDLDWFAMFKNSLKHSYPEIGTEEIFNHPDPFSKQGVGPRAIYNGLEVITELPSTKKWYGIYEAAREEMEHGSSDFSYYHPVTSFLHGAEVTFIGNMEITADAVLVDENGSSYEVKNRLFSFYGSETGPKDDGFVESDGSLFVPVEPEKVEGDDPGSDEDEPLFIPRYMGLRHSLVEVTVWKKAFKVPNGTLPVLGAGQGIFKQLSKAQLSSIDRFVAESNGRELAGVSFSKPVPIPRDIGNKLLIARDYKKARKKACLSNDWEKQSYAKGVTWGQVNSHMNSLGSLSRVFVLSDPGFIPDPMTKMKVISKMSYMPGTTPAQIKVTADGVDEIATVDSQDIVWMGLAQGVQITGITLASLSASWDMADAVETGDVNELKDGIKAINEATSAARARMLEAPYVFDPGLLAVLGYPDLEYMTVDEAYKAMIGSAILYSSVGEPLWRAVFVEPSLAVQKYIAVSRTQQSKMKHLGRNTKS